MYNTNFSASNPVQTSDEYSFEGTKKMKKKRSSFSLSTIIGAVVFGVLVLGVIAANMGSQQSQDLRNQAAGPSLKQQMEAGKGGVTEGEVGTGMEAGTTEGTIALGNEDGNPPSLQCPSDCRGTCENSPTCSLVGNCGGCSLNEAYTKRFVCGGKHALCNELYGSYNPRLSATSQATLGLGDLSDPMRWCSTVQLDGFGPGDNDYKVAWIGDRGEVCVEGTGCNPNDLDWDCTNASPSPSPSPTPSCPSYGPPTVNCLVDQATGRADINVQWSSIPGSSSYVVRADHRWGTTNQCRGTNGQLVGWYCPRSTQSNGTCNSATCDDRFVSAVSSTQTLLANVEVNLPYRIYVQQNGGQNCSTQARDIICRWTPTTSPSPSPSPSPSSTPRVTPSPVSSPSPSPIAMGPMCMSIARQVQSGPNDPDPNTPDVGDYVTFYCGSTATQRDTVTYEFRWQLPDGQVVPLTTMENVGNQTWPNYVEQAGQYHAQCRVCVVSSRGEPLCQPWEPLPGELVKGAYTGDPMMFDEQAGDPAEFDSINDYTQQ